MDFFDVDVDVDFDTTLYRLQFKLVHFSRHNLYSSYDTSCCVLQYPLLWKLFNFRSYPATNEADRNKIKISTVKSIFTTMWMGLAFFLSLYSPIFHTFSFPPLSHSLVLTLSLCKWCSRCHHHISAPGNCSGSYLLLIQFTSILHQTWKWAFCQHGPFIPKYAFDWTEVIFCSIRDSFMK